jgi:hypothetical protein
VIVGVIGIFSVLYQFPAASRFVGWIGAATFYPAVFLCRGASAIVDFLLAPRGGRRHIAWWKYGIWALVALIPAVIFFAELGWPVPLPHQIDPGYLLFIGALLQILVLGAAFFIVFEDFDVMDGVVGADARWIRGARTATRPTVIAVSVALFALYAVAIAYWLAEVRGFALFDQRPRTGFSVIDYILVALRALPSDLLLSLLDRLTGDGTKVVFSGMLVAQAYYFAMQAIGSLLLVGLVAIAIQEHWRLRRIVTEIGESDERHTYLVERAGLAPPVIRRGILRAAVSRSATDKQKRLIVAAKEIGISELPQSFCRYLESFDPEVQVFGLEQSLEMFRYRSKEFAPEQCEATLRRAAHVLRRGKLKLDPLKKLLRLMTSIAIVKKGSIEVPNALREMIFASVKKELAKPRAQEDAALRGFLRDLQSALGGSSAVAKIVALDPRDDGWVKRLAESAVQGDGLAAKSNGAGNGKMNGDVIHLAAANGNGHAPAELEARSDANSEAASAIAEIAVMRLLPPPVPNAQPDSLATSEHR